MSDNNPIGLVTSRVTVSRIFQQFDRFEIFEIGCSGTVENIFEDKLPFEEFERCKSSEIAPSSGLSCVFYLFKDKDKRYIPELRSISAEISEIFNLV